MIVRQGDIMLLKVARVPDGMVKVVNPVVVGLGEVSGHRHEVMDAVWMVAPGTNLQQFAIDGSADGMVFVVAGENASIQHLMTGNTLTGEHDTIDLSPGVWQVVRQSEYSPSAIRSVAD